MNVWSLDKHKSLKLLLLRLDKQIGFKKISFARDEDDDYQTVMLVKPDQPDIRAYIYTHGQAENIYGIHLEYPWFIENEFNDSILVYENLTMQQVINSMVTHFDVASYEMVV